MQDDDNAAKLFQTSILIKFLMAKDLQLHNLAACKETTLKKKEITVEGFSQSIS